MEVEGGVAVEVKVEIMAGLAVGVVAEAETVFEAVGRSASLVLVTLVTVWQDEVGTKMAVVTEAGAELLEEREDVAVGVTVIMMVEVGGAIASSLT